MAQSLKQVPTTNSLQYTLASGYSAGDSTLVLNQDASSVLQFPCVLVVDRINTSGSSTPTLRTYYYATGASGATLTGISVADGTDQAHAVGAIVEFVPDVKWAQSIYDGLSQVIVPSTGALDTTKVVNLTSSQTITNKTLTSPILGGTPVLDATSAIPFYNDSLYRQALINSNFDIAGRAATFVAGANNDDVYTLDHWNLISDGNDVFDVSQEAITDLPGSNYAIKLDVETAKRGGIVQFLEAKDAQKLKGKTVSISFAVKSANITALRATVLSWASTADSITSDVVGTWDATPTWATNWADNATPADLTVTSSWTTVKVEGIVLDESTVNNLALVIWTPNEETIGDIVYITQAQLCAGDVALPYMPKSYEEELRACQRYCKVFSVTNNYIGDGHAGSSTVANIIVPIQTMRTTPSLTATAGEYVLLAGGDAGIDLTDISLLSTSTSDLAVVACTVASGLTTYRAYRLAGDNGGTRLLILSAEL